MPKFPTKAFETLKSAAKDKSAGLNAEAIKEKAAKAGGVFAEKAGEIRDSAVAAKEDITEKLTELDRMLQQSITEYNDAFTLMNDKGIKLYIERCRAVDSISNVEC